MFSDRPRGSTGGVEESLPGSHHQLLKPSIKHTDAEEFELEPPSTDGDNEPLLPRYKALSSPPPVDLESRLDTSELSNSLFTSNGRGRGKDNVRGRKRARSICCCISAIGAALIVALVVVGVAKSCIGPGIDGENAGWDIDGVKEWLGEVIGSGGMIEENDPAFPTNIGYEGPTPTGSEPALLATAPALPLYTAIAPLIPPSTKNPSPEIFQYWAHLSPYHSVKSHGLEESSSLFPEGCELQELHWLQRHGARYPTGNQNNGPGAVANRMSQVKGWKASGQLEFLNNWKYKLGSDILTPYGRNQLFNLGVAARLKYGFLLDKMSDHLPVLRTESQNRMLRSAQNFAMGFFGYPADDQYHLEVAIESPGFNCTLAPYHRCPNDDGDHGGRGKAEEWDAVFLKKAKKRLQKDMNGYEFTIKDLKDFMELCAYETVALGYSSFCPLFTEKEWHGFQYRYDISWWYSASFGSPFARAQGLGWLQELVARLSHTPLTQFNSTTNSTLHDEIHFPVNDPLYIDFTHDTVFANLIATLNLTSFAKSGPPPLDHIPDDWSFVTSKIVPFATNMQVQVLNCDTNSESSKTLLSNSDSDFDGHEDEDDDEEHKDKRSKRHYPTRTSQSQNRNTNARTASTYARIILNDAPVPLTGLTGCPEDKDGLCPLDNIISAWQTLIGEIDFEQVCLA